GPSIASYASAAAAAAADVSVAKDIGDASASAKRRSTKGKGGRGGAGGSGGGGGGSGSGGGGSSGGGGGSGCGGSGGTGGGSGGSGGGGGGSGGSGGSGGGGTGGGRTGPRCGGPGGGQRQKQQRRSETQSLQELRGWLFQRGTSGGSDSCPYVIRTGDRADQTCGKLHTQHRSFSCLDDAWHAEFGDEVERPRRADLLSAKGDCYWCVPPDPGIAATALGASESGTLPGTAPAKALHTFTLDSGASCCFFRDSTTLTPLPAPVPVTLADPSRGPVVARCAPVSGGSIRLTVRSSPPLVLYELGEYRCPPGCNGHYHHSWGLACVDLHVHTDGASPVHVHSLARVKSVHTGYRASSRSYVCSGVCVRSDSRLLLVSPPVAPDSSVAPPPGSPLPATPSWHAFSSSCIWSTQVSAFLASRGGSAPLLTPPRFPR
ncbi:unnamed protein product, partial [Closterium sp. NIES-53]